MIRHLRIRSRDAALLYQKLSSKLRLVLIDLLDFEEETDLERAEGIPGAIRVAPQLLRESPHLILPEDVEVVLYCTSPHEILSARVALMLQRKGISNVWVLDGGLHAWHEDGFPMGQKFEDPENVGRRVGLQRRPDITRFKG